MQHEHMQRVSKASPCPVCDKPDWCLIAKDGSAAICQRIEEGSVKKCGNAGWLHILIDRHNGHNRHRRNAKDRHLTKMTVITHGRPVDFRQLANQYRQQISVNRLKNLTQQLGVSARSLKRLCVGWDGAAYTFPMSNDLGRFVGIRRRLLNGKKLSVKGSKSGLFIPENLSCNRYLLVCEGESDTAAALNLGFSAIGRPNCNSMVRMAAKYAKGKNVVIVSDSDPPGRKGAEILAAKLVLCCPEVRIILPHGGIKDLRQWLTAGLTSAELRKIIEKSRSITMRITMRKSFRRRAL